MKCLRLTNCSQLCGLGSQIRRQIYNSAVLCKAQPEHSSPSDAYDNRNLWNTTLPHRKKKAFALKIKKKFNMLPPSSQPPLILCKNTELNHYFGQTYESSKILPLASKGWHHNKAKGDHFTIHLSKEHPAFLPKDDTDTPILSFSDLEIHNNLVDALKKMGITAPTKIQVQAIPIILKGKNTLITAETGCGKTLAYLLPILHKILLWKASGISVPINSPLAMVVVPSRDLALQVGSVARELCRDLGVRCKTIIGGHTSRLAREAPTEELDLVITTLGVISKLTTFRLYKTNFCKHLVFDEADTLLDDSFNSKSINFMKRFSMIYCGSKDPQELPHGSLVSLVSATLPRSLPEIVNEAFPLESLHHISTENLHRIQPHVQQKFLRLCKTQKSLELLKLAKSCAKQKKPLMIFSNSSPTCDWISLFLNENGVKCINLHSKMHVDLREGRLESFKNGEYDVISCTDLASRGIDTVEVKHVLNYELPMFIADYIHRCGRVGRVGSCHDCVITNFVTSARDAELAKQVETSVRIENCLPNVNANISRILHHRMLKKEGME